MITEIAVSINETLRSALEYEAAGISVIPINPGSKKAACAWEAYQQRRPRHDQLVRWFGDGSYQLAVVSGAVSSDLGIRDFDQPEAYRKWEAQYRVLADDLPTVETSKGYHVWFRVPQDHMQVVRAAIGKKTGTGAILCGDGELRASCGCYTLAPPSIHPSGKRYRWLRPFSGELPEVDLFASGLVPDSLLQTQRKPALADFLALNTDNTDNTGQHSQHKVVLEGGGDALGGSDDGSGVWEAVTAAIERTAPTDFHERNKKLFAFARELKSIPMLTNAPPETLEPYFRRWHEKAKPYIQPDSPCQDYYAHLAEFERAFEGVERLIGRELIREVLEAALAASPPKCAEQFDQTSKLPAFVAFVRELQRRSGHRPFYLDCRAAGAVFGVSHVATWSWLKLLERRKIVKCTAKGKRGKASEYRYLGGDE